jgi:hypothetical protein
MHPAYRLYSRKVSKSQLDFPLIFQKKSNELFGRGDNKSLYAKDFRKAGHLSRKAAK